MADVSNGPSVAAGATSGALVAIVNTWVGPWDARMAGGVLVGALIYLMRSREDHWARRAAYFALSMPIGYAVAVWIRDMFPNLPAWLVGFICAALVVAVTIGVIDSVTREIPAIISSAASAIRERIARFISGGGNGT